MHIRKPFKKIWRMDLSESSTNMSYHIPKTIFNGTHKPGKVRRVCNAASKFKGTSLNDKLLTGPDLLRNLIGIIFRFREHEVVINADIESMFLQVGVPVEDCRVLRFLWRNSDQETLHVYEYNHVLAPRIRLLVPTTPCNRLGRISKMNSPRLRK